MKEKKKKYTFNTRPEQSECVNGWQPVYIIIK